GKLGARQYHQQRNQDRPQRVNIGNPDFEPGKKSEDARDYQVGEGPRVAMNGFNGLLLWAHALAIDLIRYTTLKMTIQTISTKCQYRAAHSTATSRWRWVNQLV